jgi:hypothetical protein
MTLLDAAKAHSAIKFKKNFTREQLHELAMAWVRDEVGIVAVAVALGYKPSSVHTAYIPIARVLKDYIRSKKL